MQFDRHPEEEEGANTTGIFDDSTDTYTAAATDAMNYQIVTGSTGTSISLSFIEVYGNATPASAATNTCSM